MGSHGHPLVGISNRCSDGEERPLLVGLRRRCKLRMTEWIHAQCAIESDEVAQPPQLTTDTQALCYRCGVGATNTKPGLWKYEVREPVRIEEAEIVGDVLVTTVIEEVPQEEPEEPVEAVSEADEIARLKAELAELKKAEKEA
jgi:hypothetical protein